MFTLNIRDIVAVGKSGMKWNIDAQKTLTEAKQKPNPAQAIRDKITELSVIPSTETADQKATREATKAALEAGLQDILASTADKIATERTEQGNETQANAVLRLLELKHPDAVKGLSYDMQEYLKHANISSLTRLLSAGNAALVALKNEFTDDGGLTRKVGLQLQEIGYTADGALGSREAKGLYSFLKFYTSAKPEVQATLDTLGKYAQGGLDSTVALRQAQNVTSKGIEVGKESNYIVSALTDTYAGSRIARSDLSTHLTTYLKKPANVTTLSLFLGDTTTPATLMSIAAQLQKNPVITAKFYDAVQQGVLFAQTYNASANFDVYLLDKILKGTYASTESKDANESPETKLDKKFVDAIKDAKKSAESLEPKERDAIFKKINDLENNPTAVAEVKKEFIRLAHLGVMANIGKGANMIGIGASFATAIDNLTVNIGAGTNGVFGVAARYGDTWKIGETTDSTWRAGAGVSAGFPAFIALDGSISRTDKIKIFGGGGLHDISTDQLAVAVSKGFSSVVYSRLDNREDNIREYGLRLESALSRIAFDTTSTDMITKIQTALTAEGLASTKSTQLKALATQLTTAFAQEKDPASRLLLLRNIGEHQTRMLLGDEVANSVDGKSFRGFSIGIGHILGVTFPVAGLTWDKVEQNYTELAAKKTNTQKEKLTTSSKAPDVDKIISTSADKAIAMEIAKDLKLTFDQKMVDFILDSRGTPTFNEFQSILAGVKEGKREDAYKALQVHLDAVIASRALKQYAPQAKALSEQLKTDLPKNKDMSLLSDINSLTSGTQYSRKLGASIGTPAYTEAMKNTQALNPFLNATKKITQNTWGDNRFDALYTKEKFDGFTSRTSAPSENFIGMVDYEQTLGKATKFDTMTSGYQLVGVTSVDNIGEQDKFVDRLLQEFKQSRGDAYKDLIAKVQLSLTQIGSTLAPDTALTQILKGGTITGTPVGNKPQTISSTGAEVFKALSAVPGATCFNSAAYMKMPAMTVTTVSTDAKKDSGQTTTKTETLDVPPASGTRADGYETDRYTVGVSGYSEKPTKEPPKKEEKPPIGDGPKPPEVKPPEQTPTPGTSNPGVDGGTPVTPTPTIPTTPVVQPPPPPVGGGRR